MNAKVYEKPSLKKVSLRSNAPVADCWNEATHGGTGPVRYYDTTGHGFVAFRIVGGGNCKEYAGTTQEVRYTCILVENGEDCVYMTPENSAAAITEFQNVFQAEFDTQHGNPNSGSPFHGISDTFPPDPHDMS